jgi:hypothetical protein
MDNYFVIARPPRLSDKELMAIFPEAAEFIPQKLRELRKQRKVIAAIIDGKLAVINNYPDEMSRWFWRQWLKLNEGDELLTVDRHIARLERQLGFAKGLPTPKGVLTDDVIQAARDVPVESLFNQPFKRAGRTLLGLCPFHDERTPSFHIYPDQNRGWCFGCNHGGDAIGLTMMLHDCGFREAVVLLTEGQS